MSEEEKKAIDILKNEIADIVLGEFCDKCGDTFCNCKNEECYYIQAIDIIVNLVDKQQKEIEELKKPKFIINAETGEVTKIHNDFISKDKIRDKIKELENKEAFYYLYSTTVSILNELLEE